MNRKTTQMIFGFLALVIVGGAAYLYMLIGEAGDFWPAENEPGTLTRDVGNLKDENSRLSQEVAKIPAAKEELEKISVDYDLATRVLPRESSPDQLIAAIRTKAAQAGVSPTSLQPSIDAGGRGGSFETWRFSITLTGNYDQLATFINRMEEFESADAASTGSEKRFFEVKNLTIIAEQNGMANLGSNAISGPDAIKHACTLVMQTYRYTGE